MLKRESLQHIEIRNEISKLFPLYAIREEFYIGEGMYLDLYIKDFSVGIEVNGAQHYIYSKFMHGDELGFEISKLRDRKKMRLCAEQDIGLYVVRYDEEFDPEDFMFFICNHLRGVVECESCERKYK